jgi:two-component system osmolarity sensor histidine kinase EnvZ
VLFYLFHPLKLVKRLLPRSFWGRSLLIVITPVLLIQLISSYVFLRNHWEHTTRSLALGIAGDIAVACTMLDGASSPEEQQSLKTLFAQTFDLEITSLKPQRQSYTSWPFQSRLERALKKKLSSPYLLYVTQSRGYVWVRLKNGEVVCFSFATKRLFSPSTPLWLLCSLGASFFFALLASFFMKRQTHSLRQLVLMAEGLEEGKKIRPQRLKGALEIRRIGHLFFLMQRRLVEKMEEQAAFLAGISHDLRTPLTRMRLQLALMPSTSDVGDLQRDVEDMIHMVEEYLDFIRQEEKDTPHSILLKPFLKFVCKSFTSPKIPLTLRVPEEATAFVQPSSLRRCVQNLLENALRYGRTTVEVWVRQEGKTLSLTVDDDGPGIPPPLRQAVFKPFFRIDSGRNLQTGGAGLGLAIVAQLTSRMGGTIELTDSPLGGVRAHLLLPVAAPQGLPPPSISPQNENGVLTVL